ncbi:MAG: metallophosphoesterase family protein [Desulforhopalus sp.]
MKKRILLISDIHGNYPALQAISSALPAGSFDYIVNCGDSLVYAPFPNETIDWLRTHRAISILGNTDKKVIKLLKGKSFKKPAKQEKRIMYTTVADTLTPSNVSYLLSLPKSRSLTMQHSFFAGKCRSVKIGIFHGSPAHDHEFIFADTPDERFHDLAAATDCNIVVSGHSHSPYHKVLANIHFINPGSVGRMFDGDPRASCATLELSDTIDVTHHRIDYPVNKVTAKLRADGLPEIYALMFKYGRKMN